MKSLCQDSETGLIVNNTKKALLSSERPNKRIQSNLDSSNTDCSFTMANSNSFLRPCEVLLIAQENKYLGKFSYFIVKLYVVCTH